jgi:hypothetical protein
MVGLVATGVSAQSSSPTNSAESPSTGATTPNVVAVSGRVLDARVLSTPQGSSVVIPDDLSPIAGAQVSVAFPSETVKAVSDQNGDFTVARPAGTPAKTEATVTVNAPGLATWQETGVPVALPNANYPILTVELTSKAQSQAYPQNPTITGNPGNGSGKGSGSTPVDSCSGYFSNEVPPATIIVDNVGTGTLQTYDFKYYVENVLPNEWVPSWPATSLEAGGMAVKTYGWYWVNNWDGGTLNGSCYDVQGGSYSNGSCDVNYQCFRPGTATDDYIKEAYWNGSTWATYNSGWT